MNIEDRAEPEDGDQEVEVAGSEADGAGDPGCGGGFHVRQVGLPFDGQFAPAGGVQVAGGALFPSL